MQTIYLKTKVGEDHCGECVALDDSEGVCRKSGGMVDLEQDYGADTPRYLRFSECKEKALVGVEGIMQGYHLGEYGEGEVGLEFIPDGMIQKIADAYSKLKARQPVTIIREVGNE